VWFFLDILDFFGALAQVLHFGGSIPGGKDRISAFTEEYNRRKTERHPRTGFWGLDDDENE
jgi:hypothetical protein